MFLFYCDLCIYPKSAPIDLRGGFHALDYEGIFTDFVRGMWYNFFGFLCQTGRFVCLIISMGEGSGVNAYLGDSGH